METFTGMAAESQAPEEKRVSPKEIAKKVKECEKLMQLAAKELRFEDAARHRDELKYFRNLELLEDHPL